MAKQIQKEKPKQSVAKKPSGSAGDMPDVSASKKKIDKVLGNVEVLYGAEAQTLSISGHNVMTVRGELKHVLNIPDDAQARVNGELVDGDYVLQEHDTLEFVKVAGQKGKSLLHKDLRI